MSHDDLHQRMAAPEATDRLAALREAVATDRGGVASTPFGDDVNNHVHTTYSFSPYTPTEVAFHARCAGLRVVGSVDHDSIGAAGELHAAARIVGMGATTGAELRVDFADTPFAELRLNNPDTTGNAYIVLHGVPAEARDALAAYLRPINAAREARNRVQLARLNTITAAIVGGIDYDADVRPLSQADDGGSVTERHILFALVRRLIAVEPDAARRLRLIEERFGIDVPATARGRLLDGTNPHVMYDTLGVFKAELVPEIFVQPDAEECPPVREVTGIAREVGAIPAYAYLGDVAASPTGDKKAQAFEDAFVEELFDALPGLGFQAVTYMPPRNSAEQLARVQALAARQGLLEISGVDINSSRQQFTCPEILLPQFRHLIETTWALVGHEAATSADGPSAGFCGADGSAPLAGRIARFAARGRATVASVG